MISTQTMANIIFAVISLASAMLSYYFVVKKRVQDSALNAINSAEDLDKSGAEKMEFAVEAVYSIIPPVIKPFMSKDIVEGIIQAIFDKVAEFAKKQSK